MVGLYKNGHEKIENNKTKIYIIVQFDKIITDLAQWSGNLKVGRK